MRKIQVPELPVVVGVFNVFFFFFQQVQVLLDNLDVTNVNSVNLRAAMSAALLLLPSNFTEVLFLVTAQSV